MRVLCRIWTPTGDLLLTDGPAVTLTDRETGETLRFVPGLDVDEAALAESMSWLSDSLTPRQMPITVLRPGGLSVEGTAEVARLESSLSDYADRTVVARGDLRSVAAESHWWSAVVVEDALDDRGLLLDPLAVVGPSTFPRSDAQRVLDGWPSYTTGPVAFDARIEGAAYPLPLGVPGIQGVIAAGTVYGDSAISSPGLLVENAGAPAADSAILVAVGTIEATHLRHLSVAGSVTSYGERLAVQTGHDMAGRLVSLVQPATSVDVDAEHWLAYSEADGGGAPNPYGRGLLRRFDHVIRYALDRSTLRIARRELPRLGALSSLMVDTVLTGQARPSAWLRSELLALLPVSVATGPDGLYVWPWLPAVSRADAEIELRVGVNAERVAPWVQEDIDMTSRVTVAYGLDARGGNMVRRYTVCGQRRPTDDPSEVGLDYWARRALAAVGEREVELQAPIVCDDATAQLIARMAVQVRCRPQWSTTLACSEDERLRPGVLVRVVDVDPTVDTVAEVVAVRYSGADTMAVDVRKWAQQGPED